jgi:transcriptional regulator with XRE-family HTH domain
MEGMAEPLRPTVRRRRLGRELRRLREDRGLTLEAAARRLDRTFSSLSKIERGMQGLRQGELAFILDQYGVTGEDLRQALLALRKDANKKGWWQRYKDALSLSAMDFISLEADATAMRIFEALRIPGLLQTEDYVRTMIRAGTSPPHPDEQDALVAVRLTRQQILTRPDPPRLWVIISEAALQQNVGGSQVMGAQLGRLLEVAQLGNVMLQVLPNSAGATPGLDGPFTTLDIGERGELSIVYVDTLTRAWYLEDDEDLRRYRLAFDHLCAAALSQRDSLVLIERVMSEL